jgi:hypothetical protein
MGEDGIKTKMEHKVMTKDIEALCQFRQQHFEKKGNPIPEKVLEWSILDIAITLRTINQHLTEIKPNLKWPIR